jgi:hypothetical protein
MAQNFARNASVDQNDYNTVEGRDNAAQTMSDRAAILSGAKTAVAGAKDIGRLGIETLGTGADYTSRFLNSIGVNTPRVPAEFTLNRGSRPAFSNLEADQRRRDAAEAADIDVPATIINEAAPKDTRNIDSQYVAQDMQEGTGGGNAGIPAAPGARLVNPAVPGAPRATSQSGGQGGVSPSISRQISSVNPGAPATLSDAESEASKSPRAAAAVSMLDKYVAMLEKSGEDVGRQKKEALYMALIQGGLGMMGGTSPNAFANIAAGMLPATQGYQQALAGIRKDDRARVEKLINAGLSKEKLGMELKKLGIEEKKVDAMVNYYNARAGAAGGSGSGDGNKKNAAYNMATAGYQREVGKAEGLIAKIKQDNSMYLDYTGKDPKMLAKKNRLLADIAEINQRKDNMYTQYRSYVTDRLGIDTPDFSGAAPKSNAPAVGTVKDGFKFKGGNPGDPKSWEKV